MTQLFCAFSVLEILFSFAESACSLTLMLSLHKKRFTRFRIIAVPDLVKSSENLIVQYVKDILRKADNTKVESL